MIDSKQKYREYLKQDRLALGRQRDARPRLFGDEIWKFEILLRKVEYDLNCRHGAAGKLIGKWHKMRFPPRTSPATPTDSKNSLSLP